MTLKYHFLLIRNSKLNLTQFYLSSKLCLKKFYMNFSMAKYNLMVKCYSAYFIKQLLYAVGLKNLQPRI